MTADDRRRVGAEAAHVAARIAAARTSGAAARARRLLQDRGTGPRGAAAVGRAPRWDADAAPPTEAAPPPPNVPDTPGLSLGLSAGASRWLSDGVLPGALVPLLGTPSFPDAEPAPPPSPTEPPPPTPTPTHRPTGAPRPGIARELPPQRGNTTTPTPTPHPPIRAIAREIRDAPSSDASLAPSAPFEPTEQAPPPEPPKPTTVARSPQPAPPASGRPVAENARKVGRLLGRAGRTAVEQLAKRSGGAAPEALDDRAPSSVARAAIPMVPTRAAVRDDVPSTDAAAMERDDVPSTDSVSPTAAARGMRVARVPAAEVEAAVARVKERKVAVEAEAVVERVVDEERVKEQERELLEVLGRSRVGGEAEAEVARTTVELARPGLPARPAAPAAPAAPASVARAVERGAAEAEVVEGFEVLPGFHDDEEDDARPSKPRRRVAHSSDAAADHDAAAPAPAPDLDALYDRLADRLRRELLDDHERRGSLRPPW